MYVCCRWWNPLDEGEEESSMEECGLAEARSRMKVVLGIGVKGE